MNGLATLLLGVALLAGASTVAGCASRQYDPNFWHQNFVTILQNKVGTKLGYFYLERKYTVSSLSNGNTSYRFFHGGTCYYTLEVDPKTDIIVAATWEGDAKDCIIIP